MGPRQNRGATIVEVLVALLVLTIGMGGYWYGLRELNRSDFREYRREEAVRVAFSEMEKIRLIPAKYISDSIYTVDGDGQKGFEVRRKVARADSIFSEYSFGLNPMSESSLKQFPIEICIQIFEPIENTSTANIVSPLVEFILKKPNYQWN